MGNKKERFKMGASSSAGRESNSPTTISTEGRVGIPLRCPLYMEINKLPVGN
jgi:hypothetical protein